MIDEDLFIKWFNNQSYWHIYCDCDNGQSYCGIKRCIEDFKDNHKYRMEVERIISNVLEANGGDSEGAAKAIYEELDKEGFWD